MTTRIRPSAWLLPTGEMYYLGGLSHAEVVKRFLVGLFEVDEALANYCSRDFKRFAAREEYKSLQLSDVVEDYAVHCLRWIKIGNAYKFNNGETVTAADFDSNKSVIEHYQKIGYCVSVVHVGEHRFATIDDREYAKFDITDVIKKGEKTHEEFEKIIIV